MVSRRTSRAGGTTLPNERAESTPLLGAGDLTNEPTVSPALPVRTPLPAKQVLILCLMRFGEPIAFTLIFPFINQMIEDLDLTEPQNVGYFAGIIESLFALTTFMTVLAWGRLSDRIGRKPVLIIGLSGVALSIGAFGVQHSFVGLIVARCLGGALNGNVAVIKSVLGEITDESNQAQAFSFLPLAWALGCVVGPIIGGFLSNPAKHYPNSIFASIPFFTENPYALPCFVGALFPAVGAIIGIFFLDETLTASKRVTATAHRSFVSGTSTTIPAATEETRLLTAEVEEVEPVKPVPPMSDLLTPDVISALAVYSFLALQTIALDALLILFCYTRISLGGLGFTESQIGQALSFAGITTVFAQVSLFPPLQRRFGTIRLYQWLMGLYPIIFGLFLVMGAVSRADEGTGGKRIWVVMGVFLFLKSIANMCYGCNMLVITSAAPSRQLLGSINGLAQMCSSLMRSIGPVAASSLFALSIAHMDLFGGQLVFVVMVLVSVAGVGVALLLKEGGPGWREVGKNEEGRENEETSS